MSQEIKVTSVSTTVGEARASMKLNGIHHLVVLEGKEVVGIVSDRDLGIRAASTDARSIADVMTTNVVTASPDTTVRQAANLFRGRSIGCLPIIGDRGRPIGIVTTTDLLDLLGRGAERPNGKSERWVLRGRGPRRAGPSSRHERLS